METPTLSKPSKDKARPLLTCTLFFIVLLPQALSANGPRSPHIPYQVTWKIYNLITGETVNTTMLIGPIQTTFPTLYIDLCDLVGEDWDPSEQEPFPGYGCKHPGWRVKTRQHSFYVCPGHGRSRGERIRCGGPSEGFCANWGCETTGTTSWKPSSSWDLITVKRGNTPGYEGTGPWICGGKDCGPCFDSTKGAAQGATVGGRCNPLMIHFTEAGKKADWANSRSWGLRLYRTGWDPIALFAISREVMPAQQAQSVGPNMILADQKPPSQPVAPPKEPATPFNTSVALAETPNPATTPTTSGGLTMVPGTGDRLLNLIRGISGPKSLRSR